MSCLELAAVTTDLVREGSDSNTRSVLAGAFALLHELRFAEGALGVRTLARRAGLPKSTAHRLLVQLEELGALERDGAKYVIGGAMFVIGDGWRPEPTLRKLAQPAIRQLAIETGGSVMLTLRRSQELVVVAGSRGEADKVTPTLLTFGTRLAPATAAGQALENETFAIDRESIIRGLSCVAAPIYGASGDAIASLAIGVTRSVLDPIIDTVERAADALTAQLCA